MHNLTLVTDRLGWVFLNHKSTHKTKFNAKYQSFFLIIFEDLCSILRFKKYMFHQEVDKHKESF